MSTVAKQDALSRLAEWADEERRVADGYPSLYEPAPLHVPMLLIAEAVAELGEQQKKGFTGVRNILFRRSAA